MGNEIARTRHKRRIAQEVSISLPMKTIALPSLQNSHTPIHLSCSPTHSHSNSMLSLVNPVLKDNNYTDEETLHKPSLTQTPNSIAQIISEYKDEYKDYDIGPHFVIDDEDDDDEMPLPSLCIINHTSDMSTFADPHWTNISSDVNNSCNPILFTNIDNYETKNNLDKERFQNYLSDNHSNNELLANRFSTDTDICATHSKTNSKAKYIFLTLKNRTKNITKKKSTKKLKKLPPLQLQQSRSLTIHQINQHNKRMSRRKDNYRIMSSIIPENDSIPENEKISNSPALSLSSSEPMPILNNSKHQRKKCEIQNGITGCYISDKIAQTAALFWGSNIDILKRKQHLNIGCDMYFWLYDNHQELQHFFEKEKLEQTALRFLDMFGWLIRCLIVSNVDLLSVLKRIGKLHNNMGIEVKHYKPLLDACHLALSKHFPRAYTIDVKYCIDHIFTVAASIMTGNDLYSTSFGVKVLALNDLKFLSSLRECLVHKIGREYLYRYLESNLCPEIVVFLQLHRSFSKKNIEQSERLNIAQKICDVCIVNDTAFSINISECAKKEFVKVLEKCKIEYEENSDNFVIDKNLLTGIWFDQQTLILQNYWTSFRTKIRELKREQMLL